MGLKPTQAELSGPGSASQLKVASKRAGHLCGNQVDAPTAAVPRELRLFWNEQAK